MSAENTPNPLSSLPPELLLHVLKSVDSFSSLANLRCTSREFNNAWKLNAHCIYEAVSRRDIRLSNALKLAKLQETALTLKKSYLHSALDQNRRALEKVRLLNSNHGTVLLACELWSAQVSDAVVFVGKGKRVRPFRVTPTGKLRFQRAYYRIWILTALPRLSESVTEYLELMTLRAIEPIFQIAEWLGRECSLEGLISLGLTTAQTAARCGTHLGAYVVNYKWRLVFGRVFGKLCYLLPDFPFDEFKMQSISFAFKNSSRLDNNSGGDMLIRNVRRYANDQATNIAWKRAILLSSRLPSGFSLLHLLRTSAASLRRYTQSLLKYQPGIAQGVFSSQ